ncbi:MAG: phosphocholine cytidylyltransferase family protein [Myxococcales bacterium]|nr:phosphocholine cytidylyltransferase family protein [Myxococcales bacterium]
MKAIILAAGMGKRLEAVSGGLPKCMVPVGGRPLIDRLIERTADSGIDDVIIVTGFCAKALRKHVSKIDHPLAQKAVFVHNDRYSDMGNFYSLLVAEEAVAGSAFVKLDGDLLMDETVLPKVLSCKGPGILAVDCREGMGEEEMKVRVDGSGKILELNKRMDPTVALGEYIGVDRADAELCGPVFDMLRKLIELGETDEYYERAYELLIQGGADYEVADVTGCKWTEIDDAVDLQNANKMVSAVPDARL